MSLWYLDESKDATVVFPRNDGNNRIVGQHIEHFVARPKNLAQANLYYPYHGIPFDNDSIQKLRLYQENRLRSANKDTQKVVCMAESEDHSCQLLVVVSKVDFLSEYFGVSIGTASDLVCTNLNVNQNFDVGKELCLRVLDTAISNFKIDYISINLPSNNIGLIRAFEFLGFRYTEGFINMIGRTGACPVVNHWPVFPAVEKDLKEVEAAYQFSSFPSRFVTESGFDPGKAKMLYVKRFREVFENPEIGIIYVVRDGGQFGGAIIMAIDNHLENETGIRINLLSGMGLIVNPNMRGRNIGAQLVSDRQHRYAKIGVTYTRLGANISNRPMISCLEKLGFTYGSQDLTFSRWLNT